MRKRSDRSVGCIFEIVAAADLFRDLQGGGRLDVISTDTLSV